MTPWYLLTYDIHVHAAQAVLCFRPRIALPADLGPTFCVHSNKRATKKKRQYNRLAINHCRIPTYQYITLELMYFGNLLPVRAYVLSRDPGYKLVWLSQVTHAGMFMMQVSLII